jgi:hypothetical protein
MLQNKKPPDFANEEWRKFDEPAQKQFERTGPILLIAEKRSDTPGADECNQTGILTSASNLTPAFPDFRPVALGIRSRHSGATVPDSRRVPWHLTALHWAAPAARSKNDGQMISFLPQD